MIILLKTILRRIETHLIWSWFFLLLLFCGCQKIPYISNFSSSLAFILNNDSLDTLLFITIALAGYVSTQFINMLLGINMLLIRYLAKEERLARLYKRYIIEHLWVSFFTMMVILISRIGILNDVPQEIRISIILSFFCLMLLLTYNANYLCRTSTVRYTVKGI
jgi:hypothetical protein